MKVLSNFWKLYGAGVMQQPVADFEPMTAEQWKRLQGIARRNKLYGVVLDGISFLPDELKPPKPMIDSWAMEMAMNVRNHWDHNRVIADLFRRWRAVGVRPVLLKGQSYARYYPSQSLRMIGDIDVFVCEAEFDRAMEIVNSLPLDKDEFPDNGKHIEFFYRGKGVELHRHSAEIFHRMDLDPQYQQWSEAVLPESKAGFYVDDQGRYSDNGEWITTPPPTFNAFFTFMHLWGHFYIRMPHVRSLADWILLLQSQKGEIDLDELGKRLQQFDLLRYWQIAACFVVRYMGVNPADIPFYNPEMMRNHEKIYRYFNSEIIPPDFDATKRHPLLRKIHNFKVHINYFKYRIGIYPLKSIIKESMKVMANGIQRCFAKNTGPTND